MSERTGITIGSTVYDADEIIAVSLEGGGADDWVVDVLMRTSGVVITVQRTDPFEDRDGVMAKATAQHILKETGLDA